MSIDLGFQYIINLAGHVVKLRKQDGSYTQVEVKMALANETRKLEAVEEVTFEGYQVVMSKDDLDRVNYGAPVIGDTIVSDIIGKKTITQVMPQVIMGKLAGYRMRLS